MALPGPPGDPERDRVAAGADPAPEASLGHVDRTALTVVVGPLARPVLARVVGIHAARAELPVDRLNDAVLIADAIAAGGPGTLLGTRLPVSVQSAPGRLEVRVGPLRPGGGRHILEDASLPAVGNVIQRLADGVRVRSGAHGSEYLVVRVEAPGARRDAPPAPPRAAPAAPEPPSVDAS